MQVYKFGGASVKDAASVKNIVSILKHAGDASILVVISAMGKTTNALENLVNAYYYGDGDVQACLKEVKDFHFEITQHLFGDRKHSIFDELENVFVELLWALEEAPAFTYNHHYDQLVSQGEVLSTKIISAYLNTKALPNLWLDVRGILQTDNHYREAHINYELSENLVKSEVLPLFEKHKLLITQGFIGGTSENFTSTLGREGSDYTAALLAYFGDAEKVIIWKDVPGVLNADPKYFKNTKKIDQLSYHDAIELSYYGASVIHPKTIKPLQNKNIPLYVKSFLHPSESGTIIKDGDTRNNETSYIFKANQLLLSIQPKDFSFIAEENLSVIFRLFSMYHVRVNMMQHSAISFSVCIDNDPYKTEPLLKDLQHNFKVLYNAHVQLMTIRNYNPEIISRLSENKIILLEQRSRNTQQMVMVEDQ